MESQSTPKGIQYWIHLLEEGVGRVWIRRLVIFLLAIVVTGLFHTDGAKNFGSVEAMDQAQLARNIFEGRGYTTHCLRPITLYLLADRKKEAGQDPASIIRGPHPDIVNPPVYPAVLAALFKVLPDRIVYGVESSPRSRPPVEIAIGLLNFVAFLLVALAIHRLGQSWFSNGAGLLAALVFAGTKLNWEFVFSGLPTLWLALALVGAVALSISMEVRLREGNGKGVYLRAAGLGGLLGLVFLTRYSAGVLILPFLVCLGIWAGKDRRWRTVLPVLIAFLVVAGPWIAWTWHRSGLPLGMASLAPISDTLSFPADRLERSQSPVFGNELFKEAWMKMVGNAEEILRNEVPRLGGNWFSAFLLVGLMLPLGDVRLNRFRWLLLSVLVTLILAQALFSTHLSKLSPGINSENLLAWYAPVAFLYAAVAFRRALDVFEFPFPLAKTLTQLVAILLCSSPLLISILPPRMPVMSSPPYYLPAIRQLCGYLPEGAFVMSDMPWAIAWYGRQDAALTTLRTGQEPKEDFYRIHDFQRPFNAMLLTPLTCDVPWRAELLASSDAVWGRFYMDYILRRENIPNGFPLKYAFGDGFPYAGYLFIADRPYWREVKP
jgi:hypothetical protein